MTVPRVEKGLLEYPPKITLLKLGLNTEPSQWFGGWPLFRQHGNPGCGRITGQLIMQLMSSTPPPHPHPFPSRYKPFLDWSSIWQWCKCKSQSTLSTFVLVFIAYSLLMYDPASKMNSTWDVWIRTILLFFFSCFSILFLFVPLSNPNF